MTKEAVITWIALIALLAGGGAIAYIAIPSITRDAKEAVKNELVDPQSAQFRRMSVRREESTGDKFVCGQVNAKNAMGGYTGYKTFAYNGRDVFFEDEGTGSFPAYVFKDAMWCSITTNSD